MTGFTDACEDFRKVQWEHKATGAADTEPRAVFHAMILDIHRGTVPTVPDSIVGWELCDVPGADTAAAALHKAATVAVESALADTIAVAHYINYTWRGY